MKLEAVNLARLPWFSLVVSKKSIRLKNNLFYNSDRDKYKFYWN